MDIPEKNVLRYLGYGIKPADERTVSIILQLCNELRQAIKPKSVHGLWECSVGADNVIINSTNIASADLAEHLRSYNQAILLAATLGTEADIFIRRYAAANMEKAVIAEAICTALIEEYLSANFQGERFSPGYGDFDIIHQKDILHWLNCGTRIGLAMTDGFMLTPSKSVTAIIGV